MSLAHTLEPDARDAVYIARRIAWVRPGEDYNVIKLNRSQNGVSLLDYPGFFEEGFPVLRRYWTVDLKDHTDRFRTYEISLNPPILHRKELLLPTNHPQREMLEALTSAAEQVGLFDDPCRIGFKHAWDTLFAQHGFKVVGHEQVPIGNDESDVGRLDLPSDSNGIARHLTALTRYGLSAPIHTLARFGFLDGSKTVFDYGCGRGTTCADSRKTASRQQAGTPITRPKNPGRTPRSSTWGS